MKANELRLKNLIMFGELRHECKPCDILNLYQSEIAHREISEYKPIPLTEEWLVKFGFEIVSGFATKSTERCQFQVGMITEEKWQIEFAIGMILVWNIFNIEYVHQLQNLYFALTGEELTIKTTEND